MSHPTDEDDPDEHGKPRAHDALCDDWLDVSPVDPDTLGAWLAPANDERPAPEPGGQGLGQTRARGFRSDEAADRHATREEQARALRRQAYQRAKQLQANDPKRLALKEALKARRRELYQQVKLRRQAQKAEQKRREAAARTERRRQADARLMRIVRRGDLPERGNSGSDHGGPDDTD